MNTVSKPRTRNYSCFTRKPENSAESPEMEGRTIRICYVKGGVNTMGPHLDECIILQIVAHYSGILQVINLTDKRYPTKNLFDTSSSAILRRAA